MTRGNLFFYRWRQQCLPTDSGVVEQRRPLLNSITSRRRPSRDQRGLVSFETSVVHQRKRQSFRRPLQITVVTCWLWALKSFFGAISFELYDSTSRKCFPAEESSALLLKDVTIIANGFTSNHSAFFQPRDKKEKRRMLEKSSGYRSRVKSIS